MQRLLDANFSDEEASRLKFACEEWGFFQLANHGISDELIEKVKGDLEFFQLSLDVKEAFSQEPGNLELEGYGQAFVISEEQKLDWGDMLCLLTLPQNYRNMKFWPTHPPTFRETIDKYSLEVRRIAHCILGFMGKNIYTNGKYKSIEHRAVVHSEKERISIAAFHKPKFGELISPIPELVKDGREFYRTLSVEDFLRLYISSKLDGKSRLDCLKLNT